MVSVKHHLSSNHFMLQRVIAYREMFAKENCMFMLGANGEITGELTWDKWIESAKQVAAYLSDHNVKTGDRIVLALSNSFEFLSAFIGAWWIGAIPVPVPEPSPKMKRNAHNERLLNIIDDCNPKGIIVLDETKHEILKSDYFAPAMYNCQIWNWKDISTKNNINGPSFPHKNHENEDSIAFIQYTSGSTDKPKGVVVTNGMLRANSQAMGKACGMSSSDKVLNWMPLYHDMGLIGGVLFPNYFNAKVFLMETRSFLANPYIWLKSVSDHKITLTLGPNFAYNLCATYVNPNLPDLDFSSWRLAFNGSEPVWHKTVTLFTERFAKYNFKDTTFYPVYGMAEATLGIAFPKPANKVITDTIFKDELVCNNSAVPLSSKTDDVITFVSVGQSLPGHTVFINDPTTNKRLGEREVGEVCVSGPSVFPGYYGELLHQSPRRSFSKVLYSGDLGYFADGHLYVVDRIKDLIKIAGASYYPSDIEKRLVSIEGIRSGRIAVFEIPDSKYQTGSLVIAAEISHHAIEDDVKKKIKEILYSSYRMIPSEIVLSKQRFIPFTSSGKVMRRTCREMYLSKTLFKLD